MAHLDLRRLRPGPATILGLLALLWAGASDAVRGFVWADLREGMVRVRDLPRGTRSLGRVGFVLLFAMVALLLFGDVMRTGADLVVTSSGAAARGAQVPVVLLPLTLLMLSLAWAFLLTGALRSHPAILAAIAAIQLATAVAWLGGALSLASGAEVAVGWTLVAAVPAAVVVRRRFGRAGWIDFVVLFALVAAGTGWATHLSLRTLHTTGIPIAVVSLGLLLGFLRGLVTPLLILIGLDIAEFVLRVGRWAGDTARQRLPAVAVPALLAGVVLWRLWIGGVDVAARIADDGLRVVPGYLGAAGIVAVTLLAARLLLRDRPVGEEDLVRGATAAAVPVIGGYVGLQVLLTIALLGMTAVAGVGDVSGPLGARITGGMAIVDRLTGQFDAWRAVTSTVVLVASVVVARRGHRTVALFLVVFGASDLWLLVTDPGRPLALLGWEVAAQVDLWWMLLVAGVAVTDAVRGRFDRGRAQTLLGAAVVIALLGATGFLEDPFSPFFAFAGLTFVAFGIVWDALTSGAWTNGDSAGLPRVGRVMLYLGYLLFSVTLIVWAVATHDLPSLEHYTGGAAIDGFARFGRPLVAAVLAVMLFARPNSSPEPRT